MEAPDRTPSARVLASIVQDHESNFERFAFQQSAKAQNTLLALPWSDAQQAHFLAMAGESIAAQKAIEAADTLAFEPWLAQYMAVEGLG